MGIYDLRCALSGLSTSWPGTDGPVKEVAIDAFHIRSTAKLKNASDTRCSMFLAEQRDGKLVPFSLPVSGFYDFYGSISLDNLAPHESADLDSPTFCVACMRTYSERSTCPRHGTTLLPRPPGAEPSPHAVWVGRELTALWERGTIVPVGTAETPPTTALEFFQLADPETCGLRRIDPDVALVTCLYLDDVADAIVPAAGASVDDAELADWARSRVGLELPAETLEVRARFHHIVQWIDARGGFRSSEGGAQHTNAVIKESAQQAYRLGDPGLQQLIQARRPQWAAKWATVEDLANQHRATMAGTEARPYRASECFAVGDVIDHPTFGRGLVEALVRPNKINVKFTDAVKVFVHKPR